MHSPTYGDLVVAFRDLFGKMAIPCEETSGYERNVKILYGKNAEEDKILFQFKTRDDLLLDVKVDLKRAIDDGRSYVEELLKDLANMVEMALEKRQRETSAIITLD